MEILPKLKKYEDTLSEKSQNYIKILEHRSTSDEKRTRVIWSILHDTLIVFKTLKSDSAMTVILICIKHFIQHWSTIKDTAALQLDRLIKEAVKQASSVEHIIDLANSFLELCSIQEVSSSQTSDWFCYKVQQLQKQNIECKCPKICQSLKLFELELLSLKIRNTSSNHEKADFLKSVLSAACGHLNITSFCEHHIKISVANCIKFISDNILEIKGKKVCPNRKMLLKLLENIILCSEKQSSESLIEKIQNISSTISLLQGFKHNSSVDGSLCVVAFIQYLSLLRNFPGKFDGELLAAILKSVRKFSSLTDSYSSGKVLNLLITFYYSIFKNASAQGMQEILDDVTNLTESYDELLSMKTQQNYDNCEFFYFYEVVVRICLIAMNLKGEINLDSKIEKILQKGFNDFSDVGFTEDGKATTIFTNLAFVLVKVKRKLSENTSAMYIAETALSKVPFDIAKPVLDQWIKAKLREIEYLKSKEVENSTLMKRTIAENLTGKIPEKFLTELLLYELELYEQSKSSQISQISVLNQILQISNIENETIVPKLTCKRLKLMYEITSDSKITRKEFDIGYYVCDKSTRNWGYHVQIKLIEFLQMWSENMNLDPTFDTDLQILHDIVNCCCKNSSTKNESFCIEDTCKALLETASLLELFQMPVLKMRLLLNLRKLLDSDTEKVKPTQNLLWYTCFMLCEISKTYLSLRQSDNAEKFSILADDAFVTYDSYLKEQNASDSASKLRNLLFITTQLVNAEVLSSQGNVKKAQKTVDSCKKHDFLCYENLERSNTALFCSVLTSQADAVIISNTSEPHIYRLSNASRVIATLKASILPNLHLTQISGNHLKGVNFGGNNNAQGFCFETQMHLNFLKHLLMNFHDLAESHLRMGDHKMAGAYIERGLNHSKYLKLKHWYTAFCLLKLQMSSLQHDEENFPQLCKYFCQVVECKCNSKSSCLDDSVLHCSALDEEDDNVNEEREIVHETMGSTEDDAVLIPTQALDVECYPVQLQCDGSASPKVNRRKKLKPLTLPQIFSIGKKCMCVSETDVVLTKMQLCYANILTGNCERANALDEGMSVAKKISKITSSFGEIQITDDANVLVKDFLFCDIAASNIMLSCLLIRKNNKKQVLGNCETAMQILESVKFIDWHTHLLKSQLQYLLFRLHHSIKSPKMKLANPDDLNALIDGISDSGISPTKVHTPVIDRSQKKKILTKKSSAVEKVVKTTKKDVENQSEDSEIVSKPVSRRTTSTRRQKDISLGDDSITKKKSAITSKTQKTKAMSSRSKRDVKDPESLFDDLESENTLPIPCISLTKSTESNSLDAPKRISGRTSSSRHQNNIIVSDNGTKETKPATKSTKTRKTKAIGTRTKKDAKTKEFKIFSDDLNNENTLPKPQYISLRSPSPLRQNNVYDFDSTDDEKMTRTKRQTLKSSDNLMMARKAATQRHRKQFGTIYTDENTEKVRGRVAKSDRVKGRRLKVDEVENDRESLAEIENPQVLSEHSNHLTDALFSANTTGDFLTMKLSSQALSCYNFSLPSSRENTKKSAAFHLFSIGITTRMMMQIYASNITNNKEAGDACNFRQNFVKCINTNEILDACTNNSDAYISEITDLMPQGWTVCAMSLSRATDPKLLITRLHHGMDLFHVQIDGANLENILDKFSDMMTRNSATLKSRDKSYWWTQRRNMESELKNIITELGEKALGCFAGALLGKVTDKSIASTIDDAVHDIANEFKIPEWKTEEVVILLNSWQYLSVEQKLDGVQNLYGSEITPEIISALSSMIERFSTSLNLASQDRHHVILILDKDVQLLPWESISQLSGKSVTRLPSTDLLKMQLNLLKSAEKSVAKEGVNLKNVSYILNPNGDLIKSEQRYKEWFESQKSWKGIISRAPMQREWISSITKFDLFIYCGHGAGQKYVSRNDFRNIKTRAAALLMGCSSAKLDQVGIFEPTGIAVHYLLTGSPCVLGCLWQVTDKDIDTYLCKLLENWANGKKESMPRCTNKARNAMKLTHINGSACVVYGLPIHCQITMAKFLKDIPKM